MEYLAGIVNPGRVPSRWKDEVEAAAHRAGAAGAGDDLEFVGIGAYGIVFCDPQDRAWKAFRVTPNPDEKEIVFLESVLLQEYEWLRDAAGTPIAGSVARVHRMHPEQLVLERECVRGRPGVWADSGPLSKLHAVIEKEMVKVGWTAPEFKEDSYIFGPAGPKLVDISMAQRIGRNLLRHVEGVLAGRRRTPESAHDLAFFLLREIRENELTAEEAAPALRALVEIDPEIARGFTMPHGVMGMPAKRTKL